MVGEDTSDEADGVEDDDKVYGCGLSEADDVAGERANIEKGDVYTPEVLTFSLVSFPFLGMRERLTKNMPRAKRT